MFRFEHIEYFWFLLVIPLLTVIYLLIYYIKKKNLKNFGDPKLVFELMPEASSKKYHFKFLLTMLAVLMVIIAIAGPQVGTKLAEVKTSGSEIMIVLDISNSMMARDIKPNRLERSKQDLGRLMEQLQGSKVGLIVFAGDAYVQIPLTHDLPAARSILQGVNPNMITKQGTAIADAIELASNAFNTQSTSGKAIILISDGEDHEGNIMESSQIAQRKGVYIYTIGMGTSMGDRIPAQGEAYNRDFIRDENGNFVITRINEQVLSEIAYIGKGKYYHAEASGSIIRDLTSEIEKLDKPESVSQVFEDYESQFPFFIWIALIILIIDLFISEKKSRWISLFYKLHK